MSGRGPTYRDLIARGARAHPDRVAAIVGEHSYTFREVDERANRLARALKPTNSWGDSGTTTRV